LTRPKRTAHRDIADLVRSKLAGNPALTYESAFQLVLNERPDLAQRRENEIPGKKGWARGTR
jgi:hypothetical protein